MKKIRLKKIKKRRKKEFKFVVFIILILFSFNLIKNSIKIRKEDFVNDENTNFLVEKSYNNKVDYKYIINKGIKALTKVDVTKPETMLTFKSKNESKKVSNKIKEEYTKEDIYNEDDLKKITSFVENVNKEEISDPVVYIYNSHQLETYSSEGYENYNFTPNVLMVSYLLQEKLNSLGVKTIAEQTNISEFIKASNLPNELYGTTRIFINNARGKYKSLKYFIDIHRDSISKDISTINIDGVDYARVLFVLGTTNKTYEENEKVMREISDLINSKYDKLSRGVYKRETKDWYEAYNQDLDKNVMLIEVGAKDNTMDEVINTIDALSIVLKEYIGKGN